MKIRKTFIPSLALVLSFGGALMGQTKAGDLEFNFQPRYGTTMGNVKDDMHMDQSLGLGLQGKYALTSSSWFEGDLVYTYYPGKVYDNVKYSGAIYDPNGATASTATNVVGNYYLGLTSADARKNYMSGLSLRAGYGAKINEDWSWHAGLSIDMFKYTQEASGTVKPYYITQAPEANPVAHNSGYYETIGTVPHKASAGIGAWGGVNYKISENFHLELNALTMGYTTQNYVPYTYSGQAPTVETKSRHGFGLEVVFGLKM